MQGRLDVDAIINQMINSGGRNVKIREKDISLLCKICREIFMEQPVFLELEAPIKICGKSIIPTPFLPESRVYVYVVGQTRYNSVSILNILTDFLISQVTLMVNSQTCSDSLSTAASLPRPTICSSVTTLTEERTPSRLLSCFLPTRPSLRRTSSF